MTNPVAPPAVILPSPYPALGSPAFNAEAYAYGTSVPAAATRMGEIAQAAHQNAVAADERATLAGLAAVSASASAEAASQDAARLAALDELWLGAHAADPTTGRNGAPLVAGNAYINTLTKAVRAFDGEAWAQGLGAVAGVNSLNGEVGALIKTTLAAYGITDIATGGKGAIDLDSLITPGLYTFAAATSAPAGVTGGVVYVARDGGVLGQMVVGANGCAFSRGATGIGDVAVLSPWRRAALHNDVVVPLAGGDINCALGNRFTETVSANRNLGFTNIPVDGSYACVLEINHVAGAITMPAGTVWKGAAPPLETGKRHLIFFERAQLGTAGWYASALDGYGA